MTIPTSLSQAAQRAVSTASPALNDPAALRSRPKQQLRRYEVSTLLPNGNLSETRHIAPALPLFEDAFCAFARGSLVETDCGPVAIEDLWPGDRIVTADGSLETLVWKGSTTIVPARPGPRGRNMRLARFLPDSFGMQRPPQSVVAGPSARLLHAPAHLRGSTGQTQSLTLVHDFVDGMNVVETAPPAPVDLFHICLPRHSVIRVGGLEFETYHPGEDAPRLISHSMRTLFFNLFAHADQFSDFGPLAFPRSGEERNSGGAMIA